MNQNQTPIAGTEAFMEGKTTLRATQPLVDAPIIGYLTTLNEQVLKSAGFAEIRERLPEGMVARPVCFAPLQPTGTRNLAQAVREIDHWRARAVFAEGQLAARSFDDVLEGTQALLKAAEAEGFIVNYDTGRVYSPEAKAA